MEGFIQASIEDRTFLALADTGAKVSVVQHKFFLTFPPSITNRMKPPSITSVRTANGHPAYLIGQIELAVKIGNLYYIFTFLVLPDLTPNLILGMDFLSSAKATIDLGQNCITFSNHKSELITKPELDCLRNVPSEVNTRGSPPPQRTVLVSNLHLGPAKHILDRKCSGLTELPSLSPLLLTIDREQPQLSPLLNTDIRLDTDHLSYAQAWQLRQVLNEFVDVFVDPTTQDLGLYHGAPV